MLCLLLQGISVTSLLRLQQAALLFFYKDLSFGNSPRNESV